MKLFFKYISIFILGLVLINMFMYQFVSKPAIFECNVFNNLNHEFYDVILLSDSHGAYLENTPNDYGIFNLSKNSDSLEDLFYKLEYYTRNNHLADTILLAVDYQQFSTNRDQSINLNHSDLLRDEYNKNDSSLSSRFMSYKKYFPLTDGSLNTIIGTYLQHRFGMNKNIEPDETYGSMNQAQKGVAAQKRHEGQFNNASRSSKQISLLKKIIQLCKARNLKLIGLRFPVSKAYDALINKEEFGIDNILKEYNIEVINLEYQFINQENYFEDPDHLTLEGGDTFCKVLNKRMRSVN